MKKNYFFVASLLMLLLSVVGFSDNLFYDVHQKSNSDPKYIIHGIFCLSWFVILVIQTGFIRAGNYRMHIRLGLAGMLVAIGVFISTVYIFAVLYKGWDLMPFYVKANRLFMPGFALFTLLGYLNRKQPVRHKRYLFIGSFYMLGPVLDRVAGKFHIDPVEILHLIIWNLLFFFLFYYDWLQVKKIHMVSIAGFVLFYLIWIIAIYF